MPRTETQRCFEVLDRHIGLARPQPEDTADVPSTREARIERQRTVDQRYHGIDVLAEKRKRLSGIREDAGVVFSHFECTLGEIGALPNIRCQILTPVIIHESIAAERGPSEGGPVIRVACDRHLKKPQCLRDRGRIRRSSNASSQPASFVKAGSAGSRWKVTTLPTDSPRALSRASPARASAAAATR
jgi:hypothetical protein